MRFKKGLDKFNGVRFIIGIFKKQVYIFVLNYKNNKFIGEK